MVLACFLSDLPGERKYHFLPVYPSTLCPAMPPPAHCYYTNTNSHNESSFSSFATDSLRWYVISELCQNPTIRTWKWTFFHLWSTLQHFGALWRTGLPWNTLKHFEASWTTLQEDRKALWSCILKNYGELWSALEPIRAFWSTLKDSGTLWITLDYLL